MASTTNLTSFEVIRMPQAVRTSIGNKGADKLHVITKNDSDSNLEVYSTQRIDEIAAAKVAGPASSTAEHVATFADATGKVVKDSGYTIASNVPKNAKFTDTTYSVATKDADGLMSKDDFDKLSKIADGANNYTLPVGNATTIGGVKGDGDITIDADGTMSVKESVQLTGAPTAPTAIAGTNSTQIATTAFVDNAINNVLGASNAMTFEGTIGTGGTITALPAQHTQGDTYVVTTAGTYAGQMCEVGDMIVCNTDGTAANDAHWTVVQTNINGAITGSDANTLTNPNTVAIYDGTNNRVIKSSGYTIESSVPDNAKFTDTVYTHPSDYTAAAESGIYKITVSVEGHVTSVTKAVTKDLTNLGVATASITTYTSADIAG